MPLRNVAPANALSRAVAGPQNTTVWPTSRPSGLQDLDAASTRLEAAAAMTAIAATTVSCHEHLCIRRFLLFDHAPMVRANDASPHRGNAREVT
jgi:hypothetical protein